LLIGDLVEEVYLNAFERFAQRSAEVSLSDWLEALIDPSLKLLLRHPRRSARTSTWPARCARRRCDRAGENQP